MAKRGRKAMFNEELQTWIRDNPEQLSLSELAIKFSCSVQTIKRVVSRKYGYKVEEEEVTNA